jgi:hypothetical protein
MCCAVLSCVFLWAGVVRKPGVGTSSNRLLRVPVTECACNDGSPATIGRDHTQTMGWWGDGVACARSGHPSRGVLAWAPRAQCVVLMAHAHGLCGRGQCTLVYWSCCLCAGVSLGSRHVS